MADPTEDATDPDRDLIQRALERLQALVWAHPVAFQRAFSALAAEGRRFAETEEGAHVKAALEHSELVTRARMVWEVTSLSAFVEDSQEMLPSVFLDALAKAVAAEHIEPLLSLAFEKQA